MRHSPPILVLGILLLSGCADGHADDGRSGASTTVDTGVAIVELFTSEGCSSCPPADELPLPDDFVTTGGRMVIFVDDTHGRVFGAAGSPLE